MNGLAVLDIGKIQLDYVFTKAVVAEVNIVFVRFVDGNDNLGGATLE